MCVFDAIAATRLIVVIAVATAVTIVVLVMLVISVSIAMIVALMTITAIVAMLLAVARRIFIGVPAILDKQDALAARIIFTAVFRPPLGMAWWHA